jgi:hypothetical protein
VRRPLPPELVALGDQLETAAGRAIGRRRARRQLVLNAMASLAVAIPVVVSLASHAVNTPVAPPVATPADLPAQVEVVYRAADDVPPRLLRRLDQSSNGDVLYLPIDLRRALR